MSTRCQVLITTKGKSFVTGEATEDSMMLYHHWDGYPTNMVPLLKSTIDVFRKAVLDRRREHACLKDKSDDDLVKDEMWMLGRTGKLATFVMMTDPMGFEAEKSLDKHGDIEWFYILESDNVEGMHIGSVPELKLTVQAVWGADKIYKSFGPYKLEEITDVMIENWEQIGHSDE